MRSSKKSETKFFQIVKSSASIYESSGSQPFRTTTEIQSGPDDFEESGWVMSLTYIGVIAILSSIRRVIPEGKAGKEIPASARLEFLKKISMKHYSFVRCRRQHFSAIQSKKDSRFTLDGNTISNSSKFAGVKFLESEIILFY